MKKTHVANLDRQPQNTTGWKLAKWDNLTTARRISSIDNIVKREPPKAINCFIFTLLFTHALEDVKSKIQENLAWLNKSQNVSLFVYKYNLV